MRRDLGAGLLLGALFGFLQVPGVALHLERLPAASQLRYLLLVWCAYALLGLGAAWICRILVRRGAGRVWPPAAAVAAGLWLEFASRVDGPVRLLGHGLALLAGAAALFALSRAAFRFPVLASPRPWAALNLAGLLLFGLWLARSPALARPDGKDGALNVLLITVDTLRADHLGSYGGSVRTPALDDLAREGIVVETAISPDPLTAPSHASILTGQYPANHGVRLNLPIPLRRGVRTLPEILAARGYRTAAFVSGFPLKNRIFRLSDRFQVYDADFSRVDWIPELLLGSSLARLPLRELDKPDGWYERVPERTVQAASRWLERNSEGPFFLWVHLYAPHSPYTPPARFASLYGAGGPEVRERWYQGTQTRRNGLLYDRREEETLKALYAGEVSYTDSEVGKLLASLRRLGLLERTLVVFTADHGESLTEHGYYFDHSAALYDPSLRVPLLLRFPDRKWAGTRIARLAGLTDVAPTILDALRLPIPRRIDGRSLLAGLEGTAPAVPEVPVVSVVHNRRQLLSVRTLEHKYVWASPWWSGCRLFPEEEELYDLARDPGEMRNVAGSEPVLLARYRTLAAPYRPWLDAAGEPSGDIREEDLETLRSLGYVQ